MSPHSPYPDGGVIGECHKDDSLDPRKKKGPSGTVWLSEHTCWGNHRYWQKNLRDYQDFTLTGRHVVIDLKDARSKCISFRSGCKDDRLRRFFDKRASSAAWRFKDVHCDDYIRFYPGDNCQGFYKEWPLKVEHFPINFIEDDINVVVSSFMIVNTGKDGSMIPDKPQKTSCPKPTRNSYAYTSEPYSDWDGYIFTQTIGYYSAY